MDNPLVRQILGVIAGVVVGGLIVFSVELVGHSVFPPPVGMDLSNPDDMKQLISMLPTGALVMVLVGWLLGSLAGAWTADKIARNPIAGWIVAGIFILLTAYNFSVIPHPTWMMAAGILIPLLSAWIAGRLAPKPAAI